MARKYLVVDDNTAFAENVAEILTDGGAQVEVAAGAAAALTRIRATRFDGVVTDMKMPGLSGAELLRELRRVDPGVPVVLLSAWAGDEQLHAARRLGLLAFLNKAGATPQLLSLLQHARRDATVVLLEDDELLSENLCEALAERGFTVCSAASLDELENLEVRPLAALVDLRIVGAPDGASLERARDLFPGTPLLVLTGTSIAVSGVEVFHKPFDTQLLVARLEALAQKAAAP